MAWLLGNDIPMTLLNAAVLALWPVLPMLIVCYVRQFLIGRRTPAVFALRKSETDELDRPHRLFAQVCESIKRNSQRARPSTGLRRFFGAVFTNAAAANQDEMDDLYAHAQHLQATKASSDTDRFQHPRLCSRDLIRST
jgi:hypothetical protein